MFTIPLKIIKCRLDTLVRVYLRFLALVPFTGKNRANPRAHIGRWGEAVALRHVKRAGLIPLQTNWRARRGELDIIALDHRTLVIIEVKTRHASHKRRYAAIQAVDIEKRRMLTKTARAFERNHGPFCRRNAVRHRRIDGIEVYYSRARFGFLRISEVLWHRSLSSGEGYTTL